MKNIKRIMFISICCVTLLTTFTACNSQSSRENVETEEFTETEEITETEEVISVFKKAYDYALEKEKEDYMNSLDEFNAKAESDEVRTIEEWEEEWKDGDSIKRICSLGADESYIWIQVQYGRFGENDGSEFMKAANDALFSNDLEDVVEIVHYLNESLGLSDSVYMKIASQITGGEVTENGINVTWEFKESDYSTYSILYTKSES